MKGRIRYSRVLFLTAFSLEVVILAYVPMYVIWLSTRSISTSIVGEVTTILAGIIGFATGSFIFWRLSARFSERTSASK